MGANLLVAAMALCAVPNAEQSAPIDRLERNHCFDQTTGRKRFVQLIYWRRHDGELRVDFWEMDHSQYSVYRVEGRSDYPYTLLRWRDGRWIQFKVRSIDESFTTNDPESDDRVHTPPDKRPGIDGSSPVMRTARR